MAQGEVCPDEPACEVVEALLEERGCVEEEAPEEPVEGSGLCPEGRFGVALYPEPRTLGFEPAELAALYGCLDTWSMKARTLGARCRDRRHTSESFPNGRVHPSSTG